MSFIRPALCALLLIFVACSTPEERELKTARSDVEQKNYSAALSHYDKILIRDPESNISVVAAREAAKAAFFDAKDFGKAIHFYKHIVMSSPDPAERLNAQKQIALAYFDHLADYPNAVIELNRLLTMISDPKEKAEYKMSLARAYYYQNNFTQAENEADEFLRLSLPDEQRFDMLMLKGNIEMAKKDLTKAVGVFKELLSKYSDRAQKENVGLTLSVCYEEQGDFKSAIEALTEMKKYHPMPDYIDIRIQRLEKRLKNQPGAKGRLRK
jgi:tetratricopeptide (TPR) repeat protein